MKIAYTINGIFNSGGKERILVSKANYLADKLGYEVTIITTYQRNRPSFFPISPRIRIIDLDIHYDEYEYTRFRVCRNVYLKRLHYKTLRSILIREKFDIVASFMDFDFGFLYKIKDGSKKVLESHFSKYGKVYEAKSKIKKVIQLIRIKTWDHVIRRYDKFVVLTKEDANSWKNLPNIVVIPNFIQVNHLHDVNGCRKKIVLSIGRFTYQKGFDRLIEVWDIVSRKFPDWKLKIIGGGDKSYIRNMIEDKGLQDSVVIQDATSDIAKEYIQSSIFVMTSRYEGLPMVMLEAMSYGLPIVSFDFPCGPKDIIHNSYGGIVPNGDCFAMADEISLWIQNQNKRIKGAAKSILAATNYDEDVQMRKWVKLFESII